MEPEKKKVGRPVKKIVAYIIVWEKGVDVFERKVLEKINEGYVLLGGAMHGGFTPEGTVVLLQTMIKEK